MDDNSEFLQRALTVAARLGLARARDFREAGIAASSLARFCAAGHLVRLSRGLYRLPASEPEDGLSLALAARACPNGVVCLASALHIHNLALQAPSQVWMTIHHKARIPSAASDVRFVRASGEAFSAGRQLVQRHGVWVPVYDAGKTIVDCFKYRSRLGVRVAATALREGLRRRMTSAEQLQEYARICRMQSVMRPYFDAFEIEGGAASMFVRDLASNDRC